MVELTQSCSQVVHLYQRKRKHRCFKGLTGHAGEPESVLKKMYPKVRRYVEGLAARRKL